MKLSARRAVLWLALGATLVAIYFAPPAGEDESLVSDRVRSQVVNTGSREFASETVPKRTSVLQEKVVLPLVSRRAADGEDRQPRLFVDPEVAVLAPPHVSAPVPRPEPVAVAVAPEPPPLTFQVVGRYVDGSDVRLFVSHNGRSLALKAGDLLDGGYQVEFLSPTQVLVRHLPTGKMQSIDVTTLR